MKASIAIHLPAIYFRDGDTWISKIFLGVKPFAAIELHGRWHPSTVDSYWTAPFSSSNFNF